MKNSPSKKQENKRKLKIKKELSMLLMINLVVLSTNTAMLSI